MRMNSIKQGDEQISEEESKRKREKFDCLDSFNKLKQIKKIIQDVLTQRYSYLSKVLKRSLEKIATDMYSHDLITETVYETPTFKDIMAEFQLGMDIICDYQELVKHCKLFLQTLVDQRGPPKIAAITIAKEWTENIKRKLGITVEFNINV